MVGVDGTELPIMGKLNSSQVNALLQQSKQKTEIVFKNAQHKWKISDAGMTTVLLKMDDFQKRIGTIGALVKRAAPMKLKYLCRSQNYLLNVLRLQTNLI